MIVEGLITTTNPDGTTNVAPQGPLVDRAMTRLVLRPFQSSRTFENLCRARQGVFHVTDDVLLLAQTAIGPPDPPPPLLPCAAVEGRILADACRWYALRITSIDACHERSEMTAEVVAQGTLREFLGFNRARHAVIEAAILATRVGLLPGDEILRELARLRAPVDKTGGPRERQALALLEEYVRRRLAGEEH